MTFQKTFDEIYHWDKAGERIYGMGERNVRDALDKKSRRNLDDFMALVSPAASPFLEEMAQMSHHLTRKRFGNVIQMYIPLYLSNECYNVCTYCGFSYNNRIRRSTLTPEQVMDEVRVIKSFGFDHVLLVTGEDNNKAGVDYLKTMIKLVRPHFAHISLEVQPFKQDEYEQLMVEGLNTVYIYQETYNKDNYHAYHLKGAKTNFYYRLETPDRLGKAGIHRIGLGSLIGLEDWRIDAWFLANHLSYLEKQYWKTKFSISFPRLRPAMGYTLEKNNIADKELVQLICAYRLFNENVELSLSTRESEQFRDHAVKLGVTGMSAGSKTNPGGYMNGKDELEQFEISDRRKPQDVADMIRSQDYEPVWKDWDIIMG